MPGPVRNFLRAIFAPEKQGKNIYYTEKQSASNKQNPKNSQLAHSQPGSSKLQTPSVQPNTSENLNDVNEVVRLINQERQKHGLSALTINSDLMNSSSNNSGLMIKHGFKHKYTSGWAKENIAYGQKDAQEVVAAWLKSRGHYENIMSSECTQIGVGKVINSKGIPYWTMQLL